MNRLKKGKSLIEDLKDYTVVDIETTGLDWNFNKILEISALKVRDRKVVSEFSKIINPHEKIPYFIKNLTGINDEMASNSEELIDVLMDFKEFLGNDIIVGHNVNFDINFLYDNFIKELNEPLTNDFVDTLKIARRLLKELNHHRLDDITDYFNIEARDKHRALNDCVLTNKIYLHMCEIVYDRFASWENFKNNKIERGIQ
ncbi:MAG: 3'-5' exonuclease [Bacilli bacterium]|nr:3'-5' exonuclease [Bacilli bacterium]